MREEDRAKSLSQGAESTVNKMEQGKNKHEMERSGIQCMKRTGWSGFICIHKNRSIYICV